MISESFCYGAQCKYYLSYKCNNIEDLNNILKTYKYNIGNGIDVVVIKDDNNIIKNSNIDAYIYNKIYIEKIMNIMKWYFQWITIILTIILRIYIYQIIKK